MSILDKAEERTSGGARHEYGEVLEAAERFAAIARGMTDLPIQPEHLPMLMLALKFSRIAMTKEDFPEDSWVDVPGWARVMEMLHTQRDAREHVSGVTYEIADGLRLSRDSIAALHFHYTKHGIPESQKAAHELGERLGAWLEEHPER